MEAGVLTQKVIDWLTEFIPMENLEDTPKCAEEYVNITCSKTKAEAREDFNEFGAAAGEYLLEACQDPETEICKRAEAAFEQFSLIIGKYETLGECKAETPYEGAIV
ncbi:unnamed protein product [Larinioides sclopetarius]|uniref:Uncharacterized protein n=1 Tax=Larinioides sclopetarius TaxID=280406 RepID=A0AAV1ZXG8_9ARAC